MEGATAIDSDGKDGRKTVVDVIMTYQSFIDNKYDTGYVFGPNQNEVSMGMAVGLFFSNLVFPVYQYHYSNLINFITFTTYIYEHFTDYIGDHIQKSLGRGRQLWD